MSAPDLGPVDADQARNDLETALTEITGVARVLVEMGKHRDGDAASYLGTRLEEHAEVAEDAFNRIFKLDKYREADGLETLFGQN